MRTGFFGIVLAGFLPVSAGWAACGGTDLIAALPEAERAALDARVAGTPFPEGLFWRAERDGQVFELVGTMHIADPRLDPLFDRARPQVNAADIVLMEATPDDIAALQAQMAARPEVAYILEGPTLRDLLTPAEWEVYATEMAARGVPGFMASQFRPWLAFVTLSIPPCLLALGTGLDHGLDHRIAEHATDAGIPLAALEGPQTLFKVFDALGPEFSMEMLRLTLAQATRSEDLIATMANAYFAGQHRLVWEFGRSYTPPGLEGLIDPAALEATAARVEQVLLVDRNRAWTEVLLALPPEDRALVAVGAAHLSGPDGLLDLLDRAGFTLTRLDG